MHKKYTIKNVKDIENHPVYLLKLNFNATDITLKFK